MGTYDRHADLLSQTKDNTTDIDAFYDMVYTDLPNVNITTKQLTAMIKKVVPGYSFEEGSRAQRQAREKLRDDARKAIAETSVKKRYAGKNERWNDLAGEGGRNIGSALNTYREKHMPKQGNLDIDSQDFPGYFPAKKEIYAHLVGNVQTLIDKYNNMSDQDLVKSTDELFALFNLCDTQNSVRKELRWTEEERKEIVAALNPLSTVCNTMITKLNLLASPIGAMVDPNPLVKLSMTQVMALDQATAHIYDIGNEAIDSQARLQHGQFGGNGVGLGSAALETELSDKYKVSAGLSVLKSNAQLGVKCFDLTGAPVNDPVHTCLHDGMPVFFASENFPEKEPVLGFIYGGKTYVGDEALQEYKEHGNDLIPEPEAPVYNPNPFKWIWDKIVEALGFTSDRMLHEQAKAEYNDLVRPIREKNNILRYITDDPDQLEDALESRKDRIRDKLIKDKKAREYNKNYNAEAEANKGKKKVEEQPQIINEQPQTEEKNEPIEEKNEPIEEQKQQTEQEVFEEFLDSDEQELYNEEQNILTGNHSSDLLDENNLNQEPHVGSLNDERNRKSLFNEEDFVDALNQLDNDMYRDEPSKNMVVSGEQKGVSGEQKGVSGEQKGVSGEQKGVSENQQQSQLTGKEEAHEGRLRLEEKNEKTQVDLYLKKMGKLDKSYAEFGLAANKIVRGGNVERRNLLLGLDFKYLKMLGDLYNQEGYTLEALEDKLDQTLESLHQPTNASTAHLSEEKNNSMQMGGPG